MNKPRFALLGAALALIVVTLMGAQVTRKLHGTTVADVMDATSLKINGTAVSATAAELNLNDGLTATAAEVNTIADLSSNGAIFRVESVDITSAVSGAEFHTALDLPAKCVVYDVFMDVTTAESTASTKTIDVGLLSSEGGDADGFLVGVSIASEGIVKGTLLNTGQTLGALLSVDEDGSATLVREPHVCNGTAVSISVTGQVDLAELEATIYVVYAELG
jgi:hypothetical protein